MFLSKQNKIKWPLLITTLLVIIVAVVFGIMKYDIVVYLFLRNYDCLLWHIFSNIFHTKVWLCVFGLAMIIIYLKKTFDLRNEPTTHMRWFNINFLIKDAYNKLKNSNAFLIFCSLVVSGIIIEILKFVIGRARPVFFDELGIVGFFPFSFDWAFNSMPSGHTALSFAGLVMIGMLMPRWKWLTWGLAILIAISRVAVGAHWPTDVLLAAFIGMIVSDFILMFIKKMKNTDM